MIGYKKIGKYYRQLPGSPEYLGVRFDSLTWIREEKHKLLLSYLDENPQLRRDLEKRCDNDLAYGLSYIRARALLKAGDIRSTDFPDEAHQLVAKEEVSLPGHWDDHVERLEFYRERKC